MKHNAQTVDRNRVILVVLPLAYQDGRDRYVGFLQYMAKHHPNWNIHLVRENISRRATPKANLPGISTSAASCGGL